MPGQQWPITPGVGVDSWQLEAPTLLKNSPVLLDIIRQNSIDYSKNLIYTDFRTYVCVYKGVQRMKDQKEKFRMLLDKLLDKLTSNQIEYLYYLGCKLFGQAPD